MYSYRNEGLSDAKVGFFLTALGTIALSTIVCFIYIKLVGFPRDYATSHDGIFSGYFHGYFLVFNLVVSLFKDDVAIYQSPNTGTLYWIGYVFGVFVGFKLSKGLPAIFTISVSRS